MTACACHHVILYIVFPACFLCPVLSKHFVFYTSVEIIFKFAFFEFYCQSPPFFDLYLSRRASLKIYPYLLLTTSIFWDQRVACLWTFFGLTMFNWIFYLWNKFLLVWTVPGFCGVSK
ncbi:unnamed protein product [Meloidogyne enterolobii]|uniref:Uncharacterized protein n=1 Tax=Meloidogyne enterolobii TaxID=390850 RepID=A0ACB0ZHA4_MELEN